MQRTSKKTDIEIAVSPHPARVDWSVLRVAFARRPEHERRVAQALGALMTPATPVDLTAAVENRGGCRVEEGDHEAA